MAGERRRAAGELAAWQVSWLVRVVTGKDTDPAALNPYAAARPPRARPPALAAAENRAGWRAVEKAFFGRVVSPKYQ